MRRAIVAIGLLCVLLIAVTAPRAVLADAQAGTCETKAVVIAEVYRQIPNAFVTDLAGPLEQFFGSNLSRVEAYDFLGADFVLVRKPGHGNTLIVAFRGDCMSTSIIKDNLFVQPLLAMPMERGI
jgi:hypothetical protein